MKKLVLVAAVAAALVLGGTAPANAAPVKAVPGTPIDVSVSGTADTATLHWRAPRGSAPITGWTVTTKPVEQRPDNGVERLPKRARSHCFESLTPGTTYTFSVRATNQRGSGKAVSVQYTTPITATPDTTALYGLDAAGNVVRFPTDGSSTAAVVAPNGAGYTADQQGDVFVPTADRTGVVVYPHDGSAPRTVTSGQHVSPDLHADLAGNVYWIDSATTAVTKLPAAGGAPVSTGLRAPSGLWSVATNGTIAVFQRANSANTLTERTVTGKVTTRTLANTNALSGGTTDAVLVEADGDAYLHVITPGAAGYTSWNVVPVGSVTATRIADRTAFEAGAVSPDGFVLLESAQWCTYPSELPISPTGCDIDRSFSDAVVRAGSTTTDVPVTGIVSASRNLVIGAVDSDGDVFVDITGGSTPGLWRVPAGGGAAQQVSTAQFSRLVAA